LLCRKAIDTIIVNEGEMLLCVFKKGRFWGVRKIRVDQYVKSTEFVQATRILLALTDSVHKFIKEVRRIHDKYGFININTNLYDFINIYPYKNILHEYLRNKDNFSVIFKLLQSRRQVLLVELKYVESVRVFRDGRAVKPRSLTVEAGCVISHDVEMEDEVDNIMYALAKTLRKSPKALFVGTCNFTSIANEIIPAVSRFIGAECIVAPVSQRPEGEIYIAEALGAGLATLCGLRVCQP